jgi:hypothetical protein
MENKRLLFLGDIHGKYYVITDLVNLYDIRNANIIQVGDFGIGFRDFEIDYELLSLVNDDLVDRDIYLYAIRGNHDYKPYFDNDPFGFSNITFVKDYSVINISSKSILFMGGAISIDRVRRIVDNSNSDKKSWWSDESFELDEKLLSNIEGVDTIISHTAPTYCYPDNTNGYSHLVNVLSIDDDMLKTDLHTERYLMSEAFNIIKKKNKITNHYYGHYHTSKVSEMDGITHHLLGVDELYEEYGK